MDLATPALPFEVLNPAATPSAAGAQTPAQIRKVAEEFEAAFLTAMLQPVFSQLSTEAPFGGGQGEAAFKSFMVESMAKQTAKAGGVGLADAVTRQLLGQQGLTEAPVLPANPGETA